MGWLTSLTVQSSSNRTVKKSNRSVLIIFKKYSNNQYIRSAPTKFYLTYSNRTNNDHINNIIIIIIIICNNQELKYQLQIVN